MLLWPPASHEAGRLMAVFPDSANPPKKGEQSINVIRPSQPKFGTIFKCFRRFLKGREGFASFNDSMTGDERFSRLPPAMGDFEIAILAGGLSERMGRDKLALRIGRRTSLGHVRALAASLGVPTRVIRRDLVPRCGPIGGIYTALKRARKKTLLILSGDMPFVSGEFVGELLASLREGDRAAFARSDSGYGFPAVLRVEALATVESQMAAGKRSIQALAGALAARGYRPPARLEEDLFNLNTPADWEAARVIWSRRK